MIYTADDIYLKPCPCCGHTRPEIIGGPLYMAICRNSDCQLQIPNYISVNEAQKAWNSRMFEPNERHGDLIDRDKLLDTIWETLHKFSVSVEVENEIIKLIKAEPYLLKGEKK